jgi:hypothetical protein
MARERIQCPCCYWVATDKQDPKRSHKVSAHIQLLDHIRIFHQRELQGRLVRAEKKEAALRSIGA